MACHDCHYVIADNPCCYEINHVFDPIPASYYGGDNHCCGDYCTTRNSNNSPGLETGLFHPCGPLNVCLCRNVSTTLTAVTATSKITLLVTFNYADCSQNRTVEIAAGNIYTISYIENAQLKTCTGKVTDIYKVYSDNDETLYKIKIDCSVNYSNQVVIIKTDQLRSCKLYQQYSEEDSTIDNSLHRYGTTVAQVIKDAIVTDATIDKNGNIVKGNVIDGYINGGYTVDGIATGTNSHGHSITVINGKTHNGQITNGEIINGVVRSGDVCGKKDDDTGIVEHATIKGIISNLVIINTIVKGGKTTDGETIDPTLIDSIVTGAIITGNDMITTGGVTVGNITTGGTTVGGTGTGGTANGFIDGKMYTIENGITKGNLTTVGGVVTGGTIIGGTHIGNAIYNATIKGGVCSDGTTTGGTTTNGVITTALANHANITKDAQYINKTHPDYRDLTFNPPVEDLPSNGCDCCGKVSLKAKRDKLMIYGNPDGTDIRSTMSDKWMDDFHYRDEAGNPIIYDDNNPDSK